MSDHYEVRNVEAAVVIGMDGQPIFWHTPDGCGPSRIPDSRDLWAFLWDNRDNVMGIAHTHPGSGKPFPSHEDVTTFAAIESGFGRRLLWWILTADGANEFTWKGPEKYEYKVNDMYCPKTKSMEPTAFVAANLKKPGEFPTGWVVPEWVEELRQLSYEMEAPQQ